MTRTMTLSIAMTIGLFFATAHAAQASSAVLTGEEVHLVCANMYEFYKDGGAARMLAQENLCWDSMEEEPDFLEAEKIAAVCSTGALAGAFIERGHAMREIRGEAGAYRGEAVGARMAERYQNRFTEEQISEMAERAPADDWVTAVITGLMAAGMP